jgi:hypothetical protein
MTQKARLEALDASYDYLMGYARPLPAAEWLDDMLEALPYLEESLGEHEAQYRSEVAMFGDAGVGQGLRIREMQAQLHTIKARITALMGSQHTLF